MTVRYDANGYWTAGPGGRPLKEPVDVSWVTMETLGPDWAPPWWLAVTAARMRRLMRWRPW